MLHLRSCTPLPWFMCSVLDSLLLCCSGSHYSFSFSAVYSLLLLEGLVLSQFPWKMGRFPLHKNTSPSLATRFCLGLSQIKVQARSIPTYFLQTVSLSLFFFYFYARQDNFVQNAVLGATAGGSKSKEASDRPTTCRTRVRAAGGFVEKVLVPVDMKVNSVYLHKIYT